MHRKPISINRLTGPIGLLTALAILLAACLPFGGTGPTETPGVASVLAETLALFPLIEGTTWVYEHQAYDADVEVTWRVVESVVQTRDAGAAKSFYLAEIERTVSVIEGEPFPGFITAPQEGVFWYLVDGSDVYRFTVIADPADGWLALKLPLDEAGEGWYPDPEQRRLFNEGDLKLPGFRYILEAFETRLPTGEVHDCFELITPYNNGGIRQEFCLGVGFTSEEFDHAGTPFGYEITLTAFSRP